MRRGNEVAHREVVTREAANRGRAARNGMP
jgi:hypothetical protein